MAKFVQERPHWFQPAWLALIVDAYARAGLEVGGTPFFPFPFFSRFDPERARECNAVCSCTFGDIQRRIQPGTKEEEVDNRTVLTGQRSHLPFTLVYLSVRAPLSGPASLLSKP